MGIIHRIFICACTLLVLNGCVEKEILDDINLINGIGFDHSEKGRIVGTIIFPVYLPDQVPKNRTLTAESNMKKTIFQDLQREAADPIVTGSLEVVLFGEELAKKDGILELVDPFQRDPGVGSGLYLAVVDGKAKKLLEGEYGIKGNATHIFDLIQHNLEEEDLPKTNLQRFLFDFYQDGKTPFMPRLKQISKTKVSLNGISLFKYGKIVDTIPPQKMFFFKLLVDKYSQGLHRVKIDEGDAAVRDIRSSHQFKLTKRGPEEIVIHVKVNGIINEFTGGDLTPAKVKKIQKQFEKDINQQCLKMIKQFQKQEIDPVGLGRFVKTRTRNLDVKKWTKAHYQDLIVKVESEVNITEIGVIQ
ncbi:Ger(x)C family spore germination protein [Neobacillus sp. LXY-4]|uniref:Ger(x)C family spore germination protein n=1 Tax=Neobacillus sp. LXY-4 TaxID=3379826 RepID=UPI003EE2147A